MKTHREHQPVIWWKSRYCPYKGINIYCCADECALFRISHTTEKQVNNQTVRVVVGICTA